MRSPDLLRSAEAAELYGDLIDAMAHALGSVAGALTFRALLVATQATAIESDALAALADEVRQLMRTLRLVQGPLAATPPVVDELVSLQSWWELTARCMMASLPRSIDLRADLPLATLPTDRGRAATLLLWTGCKLLALQGIIPPAHVRLTVARDVTGAAPLRFDLITSPETALRAAPRRWSRFRSQLADRQDAQCVGWRVTSVGYRWRVRLPMSIVEAP